MKGKRATLSVGMSTYLCQTLLSEEEVLHVIVKWARDGRGDYERELDQWLSNHLRYKLGDIVPHQLKGALVHAEADRQKIQEKYAIKLPSFLWAIDHLAQRFLSWQGGPVLAKYDSFEEYHEVSASVLSEQLSCFLLALRASNEANSFRSRDLNHKVLQDIFRDSVLPMVDEPTLWEIYHMGLAETHRHLNGSLLPLLAWAIIVEEPSRLRKWMEKGALVQKDPSLLEKCHDPFHAKQVSVSHKLQRALTLRWELYKYLKKPDLDDTGLLKAIQSLNQGCLFEQPFVPTYKMIFLDSDDGLLGSDNRALSHERAFLYALFQKMGEALKTNTRKHQIFLAACHCYFIAQNLFLAQLCQTRTGRTGLERFVFDYGGHGLRDFFEERSTENLRTRFIQALRAGGVKWLELRITPSGKIIEKLRSIERVIKKHPENLPKIGIIFHFIKRAPKKPPRFLIPQLLYGSMRREIWTQAISLSKIMELPIGAMIRGLDVAGYEPAAPLNLFVNPIRWLRDLHRHKVGMHFGVDRVWEPLRVTCHAGEEFHHLLSGIRAVDEAITYLDMKAGDRIGHGLALGLNPKKWMDETGGEIFLPRGEWLRNYVWLYGQVQAIGTLSLGAISREIEHLAAPIFPKLTSSDFQNLFELEMYGPYILGDQMDLSPRVYDFIMESKPANLSRYEKELKALYYNDEIREKMEEIIRIPVDESWDVMLQDLQERVLRKLSEKKIAIEVNPSSNLCISNMESIEEHPVYEWFPPNKARKVDVPVVVGTDDPGVFSSELIYEYALLAKGAKGLGASRSEIRNWLQELRVTSLNYSFLGYDAATTVQDYGGKREEVQFSEWDF